MTYFEDSRNPVIALNRALQNDSATLSEVEKHAVTHLIKDDEFAMGVLKYIISESLCAHDGGEITAPVLAQGTYKTIQGVKFDPAEPNSLETGVVVARAIERVNHLGIETKERRTTAIREEIQRLISNVDPIMVLSRMLLPYVNSEGDLNLNAASEEVRDIQILLVRRRYLLASLKGLSAGRLSCQHETIYAGGVVSDGNRVYTYSKFAESTINDLETTKE